MKRLLCVAAALFVAAMMAFPVFAEPEETTAPEELLLTEAEVPGDSEFGDDENEPMLTFYTEPPTTVGIMPINEILEFTVEDLGATAARQPSLLAGAGTLTYAALGASLLALLLSVIALAKSGGKKNANATGNYKKFF